jgi:hypothetical protein
MYQNDRNMPQFNQKNSNRSFNTTNNNNHQRNQQQRNDHYEQEEEESNTATTPKTEEEIKRDRRWKNENKAKTVHHNRKELASKKMNTFF